MKYINQLVERYPALAECKNDVENAVRILIETFEKGGSLFLCGNGGSCSDCSHIVGELRKAFVKKRPISVGLADKLRSVSDCGETLAELLERALPVYSLCESNALSTAYANDVSADAVYAQSLLGIAKEGDVLLCISTSGNSKNCVYAAVLAGALNLSTIALTGIGGGKLGVLCDVTIKAPEKDTYKVQELHLPIYHSMCLEIESTLF